MVIEAMRLCVVVMEAEALRYHWEGFEEADAHLQHARMGRREQDVGERRAVRGHDEAV